MTEATKESRLFKQIFGALFGFLISFLITNSIQFGAGFVFPKEKDLWMLGFWGDHHILRFVASAVGSALGAFVAGGIAKTSGAFWGMMSVLPSAAFWIFVFVVGFSRIGAGLLVMALTLTITSIGLGFLFGSYGAKIRLMFPEIFETRPDTVMGVKWYHWLWLFPVINLNGAVITYSFYQALWLVFGMGTSAALYDYLAGLAGVFIILSLVYVLFGIYKVFALLCTGYQKNLRSYQIALRVAGWIFGVWMVIGFLQNLTNIIFSKFYSTT